MATLRTLPVSSNKFSPRVIYSRISGACYVGISFLWSSFDVSCCWFVSFLIHNIIYDEYKKVLYFLKRKHGSSVYKFHSHAQLKVLMHICAKNVVMAQLNLFLFSFIVISRSSNGRNTTNAKQMLRKNAQISLIFAKYLVILIFYSLLGDSQLFIFCVEMKLTVTLLLAGHFN